MERTARERLAARRKLLSSDKAPFRLALLVLTSLTVIFVLSMIALSFTNWLPAGDLAQLNLTFAFIVVALLCIVALWRLILRYIDRAWRAQYSKFSALLVTSDVAMLLLQPERYERVQEALIERPWLKPFATFSARTFEQQIVLAALHRQMLSALTENRGNLMQALTQDAYCQIAQRIVSSTSSPLAMILLINIFLWFPLTIIFYIVCIVYQIRTYATEAALIDFLLE